MNSKTLIHWTSSRVVEARFISVVAAHLRYHLWCDGVDMHTFHLTWNDNALAAFNATKDALARALLLSYPNPDAPTCLMTDASDSAVGAVLQQYINGTIHFQEDDTCRKMRHFLEGREFHALNMIVTLRAKLVS